MAVESQRIIGHSNFLFFVLLLSPNQMRDRLPLIKDFQTNFIQDCLIFQVISVVKEQIVRVLNGKPETIEQFKVGLLRLFLLIEEGFDRLIHQISNASGMMLLGVPGT